MQTINLMNIVRNDDGQYEPNTVIHGKIATTDWFCMIVLELLSSIFNAKVSSTSFTFIIAEAGNHAGNPLLK